MILLLGIILNLNICIQTDNEKIFKEIFGEEESLTLESGIKLLDSIVINYAHQSDLNSAYFIFLNDYFNGQNSRIEKCFLSYSDHINQLSNDFKRTGVFNKLYWTYHTHKLSADRINISYCLKKPCIRRHHVEILLPINADSAYINTIIENFSKSIIVKKNNPFIKALDKVEDDEVNAIIQEYIEVRNKEDDYIPFYYLSKIFLKDDIPYDNIFLRRIFVIELFI